MRDRPVAIDLFAGGGGLTVGLKEAGFDVASAIEIYKPAAATYLANHPEVEVFCRDIRKVRGRELLAKTPSRRIDLVAGCPPCQGFSSLTAKYSHRDRRNTLIREMGRIVKELLPAAVMMENVPGLAQKGRRYLMEFINGIEALGYIVNFDVLQVADYGIPQSRRRLVLLAGRGFPIEIPRPTHSLSGRDGLRKRLSAREILKGRPKPITLAQALKQGGPEKFGWHVVRTLSPANRKRLKAAKVGKHWAAIPSRLRPDCHKGSYNGFSNVYGRMRWDLPAPTITGGCTTLSKGRFGHPSQLRTISVREAAAFQTFPEDYRFPTIYMEHACDIVGNALPCDFARLLAEQCKSAIGAACSELLSREGRKGSA